MTGFQVDSEFDARGVKQTDTTKANLEVTLRAVQPDFSILELEGGTVSVSDVQTGVCTGSSKFSGTIPVPSDPVHTVTTGDGHSSGDGNLDLVVNDGNDGFSTVPYEGGQAVYVTLVLSLAYDATCPSGNGPTGETIASCRGDGDFMSGLVLLRTESGDFVGSCH